MSVNFPIAPKSKQTVWEGWNVSGTVSYKVSDGGKLKAWWVRIGWWPWQWGSVDQIGTLQGQGVLGIPGGPKATLRVENTGNSLVSIGIGDNVAVAHSVGALTGGSPDPSHGHANGPSTAVHEK